MLCDCISNDKSLILFIQYESYINVSAIHHAPLFLYFLLTLILSRLPTRMWAVCFVSSRMSCRPPRMLVRGSGFLDTYFQVCHRTYLPNYHGIIWCLSTRITSGWDGTSALLNGPNLLYQIIDRFSPHVIANVFMGHIHDEVRYIYYACVKCRIIPCLSLLIHKVETMVPSWTAQPRWLPLGSGALLPLWLDWILVRVYAVPQPTPLLISID